MGARGERGNTIEVVTTAGSIKLDFSEPVAQGNVANVQLFDLAGRLIKTLCAGCLSSSHLTIPVNRAEMRSGSYILSVKLDNKVVLNNTMMVYL
jgi:hypothetical protein